jgi:CDP-diglyceride synthetase
MILAIYEFLTISIGEKYRARFIVAKSLTIVAAISLYVNSFLVFGYGYSPKLMLFTIIPIFFVFISNLYVKGFNIHKNTNIDGEESRSNNGYEIFPFTITSLVYIALPFSMSSLILFKNGSYDGSLFLSMLIMLWATDVGAYCFGSTLGQKYNHRLFLSISPKKSWEGFWGGLFSSIAVGIILFYVNYLQLNIIQSIVLSIIICIFGVLGDLIESQFKRNYRVKDSGSIMPGHGGMLDRFDGALIAFPMAIIYLLFI